MLDDDEGWTLVSSSSSNKIKGKSKEKPTSGRRDKSYSPSRHGSKMGRNMMTKSASDVKIQPIMSGLRSSAPYQSRDGSARNNNKSGSLQSSQSSYRVSTKKITNDYGRETKQFIETNTRSNSLTFEKCMGFVQTIVNMSEKQRCYK